MTDLCGSPCPEAPDLLPCQLPSGHGGKWHRNRSSSWPTGPRRYRVMFTPIGWQVVDTAVARDPLAEFGLGRDEYLRAQATATSLNVAARREVLGSQS